MAVLKGVTKGQKAYTTLQCGRGPEDHIELNSDLVYSEYRRFLRGIYPTRPSSQPFVRAQRRV